EIGGSTAGLERSGFKEMFLDTETTYEWINSNFPRLTKEGLELKNFSDFGYEVDLHARIVDRSSELTGFFEDADIAINGTSAFTATKALTDKITHSLAGGPTVPNVTKLGPEKKGMVNTALDITKPFNKSAKTTDTESRTNTEKLSKKGQIAALTSSVEFLVVVKPKAVSKKIQQQQPVAVILHLDRTGSVYTTTDSAADLLGVRVSQKVLEAQEKVAEAEKAWSEAEREAFELRLQVDKNSVGDSTKWTSAGHNKDARQRRISNVSSSNGSSLPKVDEEPTTTDTTNLTPGRGHQRNDSVSSRSSVESTDPLVPFLKELYENSADPRAQEFFQALKERNEAIDDFNTTEV
ncbi:hypothetical protein AB0D49_41755, partial [Streptomyces sp. NPDC048290]|uniref:hypothetical protein n=1 Tax=Streptomyces sp. NPDC048290 TaxID=3155811 RepID=UPI003447BA28